MAVLHKEEKLTLAGRGFCEYSGVDMEESTIAIGVAIDVEVLRMEVGVWATLNMLEDWSSMVSCVEEE